MIDADSSGHSGIEAPQGKSLQVLLEMTLYQYLYEAQFHGSNRLAERKNRISWSIALVLLFTAAASIVTETVIRYLENTAYLTIFDSTETEMKFPSVGICPEINFPEYKVDKFLDGLYYPPGINRSSLKLVIQQLAAFYSSDVLYSIKDLKLIEFMLDYNVLSVKAAGKLLTASCEEIILRCRLFGLTKNCSTLYTMELTNNGFCCIFNGRSLTREMKKRDYMKREPAYLFTSETGPWASLITVVNNSQRVDDLDITYKWVFLESGQQFAETVGNGTPISPNSEMFLGYDTQKFVIGGNSLSPESRHCRPSTTKLKYFPSYSKRYCRLECEMVRTIRLCQCAKTAHPLPHNVARCRARDLLCAKNSTVTSAMCDCPVTCDSALEFVTPQNYPLMSGNFIIDKFYDGLDFSKVSVVRVYIVKKEEKIRSRQSYFTTEHLFAQIGGVFNLFFGCSVLTLIEVLQLIWCAYSEHRLIKALDRKTELVLPPQEVKKKKTNKNKNKVGVKNNVDLNPW